MAHPTKEHSFFSTAPAGFRKYSCCRPDGHVETSAAEGMPLPRWPDGRWCLEVALYLNFEKPRTRAAKSGTLRAVAYSLAELVRFCANNRIGFLEMTDSLFWVFIEGLGAKVEKDCIMVDARTPNRILQIGRESLAFLFYVGELFGRSNFVGSQGTVKGEMKLYIIKSTKGGRDITKKYWHHESFPPPSPEVRRHPIGDEYISLLRKAVVKTCRAPFLRQRKLLTIRLLDATGARRIEVVHITMSSVAAARAMVKRGGAPFLRVPTYKKRAGPRERLLPIDEVLLAALEDFINIFRAPVVEKAGFECGYVLVSHRGTKLEPNTLTQELNQLRKAADIKGKAHPHLFRHRYVSRRLKKLIDDLKLTSTMSVISHLTKTAGAMTKLLEETGHASIASLIPYIDDQFAGERSSDDLISSDDIARLSASVKASIQELESMEGTMPPEELMRMTLANFKAMSAALTRPT